MNNQTCKKGIFLFSLFFSFQVNSEEKLKDKNLVQAHQNLEKIFQNYQSPSLAIPIQQDIFLSMLKTDLTSQGFLFLNPEKFRLELNGKPSSLVIFDGSFLWYQPDLKEKVVFKLKNPIEIQMLNSFFLKNLFFKKFEIVDFRKNSKHFFYQLKPKQQINNLKDIFMKTNKKTILEIQIRWKDLNTWQKYTLSKPLVRKIPERFFNWVITTNFRVLEKEI
ncbi:MAG: outer membrane lipoprotein carrier protein LolA [Bdellovibrionales bacterium]|nr:outer membrane lipoprotein carrier protein LolA [Bdellovibrionales bacterium]